MSNAFNLGGTVSGISRSEPYALPPCGIRIEPKRRSAPRTAQEDIASGATAYELRQYGYTAYELGHAGMSAAELREGNFPINQIAATNCYSADELRRAGGTVLDLFGAGIPLEDLVRAGFTAREFGNAGIVPSTLVALGFAPDEAQQVGARPRQRPNTAMRRAPRGLMAHGVRPRTAPGSSDRGVAAPSGQGMDVQVQIEVEVMHL